MRAQDVADRTGYSVQYVYYMTRCGLIPSAQSGPRCALRYHPDEIARWIEADQAVPRFGEKTRTHVLATRQIVADRGELAAAG